MQNNIIGGITRSWAPILVVLAFPNLGRATVGACTTPAPLSSYSGATGTLRSTSNGCTYIDKTFSNFQVSNATYASIDVQSTAALGDTLNGTTGTGLGVADFTSSHFSVANGSADTTVAYINYVTTAYTGGTVGGYTFTNGTNGYATPPAGTAWQVSSISLNLSSAEIGSIGTGPGDLIEIFEGFCIGNNTLSTTGSCASDGTGSNYGSIAIQANYTASGTTYFYDCQAFGATFGSSDCNTGMFSVTATGIVTVTLPNPTTTLSVFEWVDLDDQGGGRVTLNSLYNGFGEDAEAPEPSTFGLLGSALAALGFLRRKNA